MIETFPRIIAIGIVVFFILVITTCLVVNCWWYVYNYFKWYGYGKAFKKCKHIFTDELGWRHSPKFCSYLHTKTGLTVDITPVSWDDMDWRAERIKFGDTRRTWVSTWYIKNEYDYGLVSFWKEHSINIHYRPWRQKGRAKGQWLCLMNDIAKKPEKYKKLVELHCYNVDLKNTLNKLD